MGSARTLVFAVLAGAMVLLLLVTLTDEPAVQGPVNQARAFADPSDEASLLWSGDFETGDLSQWQWVLGESADRLTTITSPVRQGRNAARLTAYDSDMATSADPRAQLNGWGMHREGDDHYIGWSTYFPSDFPRIPSGAWFVFFQFHGEPYSDSPSLGFGVSPDGHIELGRDRVYNYDRIWSQPLARGRWTDFTVHVKWSKDPSVGFVELWVDRDRKTFSNGQTRLRMATIKRDQTEVEAIPTNYRKRGAIAGPVTVLHDAAKVGTSRSVVQPDAPAAAPAATGRSADAP